MKNRNRQWHEELSDLLSEEATSHLSRAREALARKRAERDAREERKALKQQARAQLRDDKLDRELARIAAREIENRYQGLGGLPMAIVMMVAAMAIVVITLLNPEMAGLLWVSFGLSMGAAGIYSGHYKASRLLERLQPMAAADSVVPGEVLATGNGKEDRSARNATAASPEGEDPLSRRLEEACDRLDQALKAAPEQVKTFLSSRSGKTIDQLRATGRDLARRERRLRELSAPGMKARMEADHVALDERIARATDGSVRQSLFQARAALKEKQAHHAELEQGADRLEAERLRLSYTLEGLHAQILRLSTSTSLGAGEGLTSPIRASLEQLQDELTALAEASDEVRQMADARIPEAIAEIEGPSTSRDPLTGRPRERS
ncbi:MAG TPA: hypothetical protein VK013_13410 [Myxococcaceae bacterium]|nr:hypothetical protein [Myxococcaceae bacterium]